MNEVVRRIVYVRQAGREGGGGVEESAYYVVCLLLCDGDRKHYAIRFELVACMGQAGWGGEVKLRASSRYNLRRWGGQEIA